MAFTVRPFQSSKEGRCIILVLSRRASEGITLRHIDTGEEIHITAVEFRFKSNAMRIGFDCSDDWSIERDEIADEQAAAQFEIAKQKRAERRAKIALRDGIQVRSIDEIGRR